MFEITYNDSDTLQNFIDADKAYHGAIYDFTFEGRFIVYHFFVKDTARYVALDSMTGYGSEITRRRKDNLFDTRSYHSMTPMVLDSMSHYPIMFYKNQHYDAVMLYGHVHNTREWQLVEKWKHEQWDMGIPSRLINVGCMMDYMRYTPRTLEELLDANPMPIFDRIRQDGTPVDSPSEDSCSG